MMKPSGRLRSLQGAVRSLLEGGGQGAVPDPVLHRRAPGHFRSGHAEPGAVAEEKPLARRPGADIPAGADGDRDRHVPFRRESAEARDAQQRGQCDPEGAATDAACTRRSCAITTPTTGRCCAKRCGAWDARISSAMAASSLYRLTSRRAPVERRKASAARRRGPSVPSTRDSPGCHARRAGGAPRSPPDSLVAAGRRRPRYTIPPTLYRVLRPRRACNDQLHRPAATGQLLAVRAERHSSGRTARPRAGALQDHDGGVHRRDPRHARPGGAARA